MGLQNVFTIAGMMANPAVIRSFSDILKKFRADPSFSLKNYLRSAKRMASGEKILKYDGKYIISSFLPPFPSKAFMNTVDAVVDPGRFYHCTAYFRKTAPISMFVSLTDRCPYSCVHCSAAGRRKAPELSAGDWKRVIAGLQDMGVGVIGFTGGEPMLRNDLEEIIAGADERSVIYVFTSGAGLTAERARSLKESGAFGTGISLDSIYPDIHNRIRQNGRSFQTAADAIGNSRKAGLYTMVQTLVTRDRISREELFPFFKHSRELGAQEVRILEPIKSGRFLDGQDDGENVFYERADREELIRLQYKANKTAGMPKVTTFADTESSRKFGCGAGLQHSYINSAGDLQPCDFAQLSFGNVREAGIKELWEKMRDCFDAPQTGCFAQKIHREVAGLSSEGGLPLSKDHSESICRKYMNPIYPEYFTLAQGTGSGRGRP
ncbi:MAG: radical SAM/SPASM domain-containing protein [Spirochaetia bacterium]